MNTHAHDSFVAGDTDCFALVTKDGSMTAGQETQDRLRDGDAEGSSHFLDEQCAWGNQIATCERVDRTVFPGSCRTVNLLHAALDVSTATFMPGLKAPPPRVP